MLRENNALLLLSRLPESLPSGRNLRAYLEHMGLLSGSNIRVFDDLLDALEWMENETINAAKIQQDKQESLEIDQFAIFEGLDSSQLQCLKEYAVLHTYSPGEQIFKMNDHGHELMLIASGQVKISLALSSNQVLHLATMGRGQFFGEMSFMDGSVYSADVYAVEQVKVWSIAREQFNTQNTKDQEMQAVITKAIALALAERLRHANAELLEMKNQL